MKEYLLVPKKDIDALWTALSNFSRDLRIREDLAKKDEEK